MRRAPVSPGTTSARARHGPANGMAGQHRGERFPQRSRATAEMTVTAEVVEIVRALDPGARIEARADGGWTVSRDGVIVSMAPCGHIGALRRGLEDVVIGIRMILISRRLEALEPPDAAWPATVEQRLAALEAGRAKRRNP